MHKIIFILIVSLGCGNQNSLSDPIFSKQLKNCPEIYLEKHLLRIGGVYSGNSYSYYFTDLDDLEIFIGTIYHDDERLIFEETKDQVKMYKLQKSGTIHHFKEDTTLFKSYYFADLIGDKKR